LADLPSDDFWITIVYPHQASLAESGTAPYILWPDRNLYTTRDVFAELPGHEPASADRFLQELVRGIECAVSARVFPGVQSP